MEHRELHRLMSAAIVNQRFRSQLLENPIETVRAGYLGHAFALTSDEQEVLASIEARDFLTFSEHIQHFISGNGHGRPASVFSSHKEP